MKQVRDDIDELILRIHGSVLDPASWINVLDEVRRRARADKALLHNPRPQSAGAYWSHSLGIDERSLETYATHWVSRDVWTKGAFERDRNDVGSVELDSNLVERRSFLESPFFNDYLRHHDIDRMMVTCLQQAAPSQSSRYVVLSLFRTCGEPEFSSEQSSLLGRLVPHLTVAVRNYWSSRSIALESAGLKELLDCVATPLFGVSGHGKVLYANSAGETEFRSARWLRLSNAALAVGREVTESTPITRLMRGLRSGVGGSTLLTNASTGARAILTTAPLHAARAPQQVASMTGLAWLVRSAPVRTSVLRRLFDLSEAEDRLLALLAQGLAPNEIARQRGVSVHTIRNQLKTVFRKTGQRTQAQLVALVTRAQVLRDSREES